VTGEKIAAVILAAGRSSRMGEFKPLLPLGGTTVIGQTIGTFKKAGIDDILVVVGFMAERLIPVLRKQHVKWVLNKDYDQGMFSSLRIGVKGLAESCEAFFVMPADHPFVMPSTITSLMNAFRLREENRFICRPSYQGRRGHPPLMSSAFIPVLLDFDETGGLRRLFSGYEEKTLNVDCDDPGIFADLDSPEDYRLAAEKFAGVTPDRTSDKA
jgi:molybdenum cofactor cytidylyltransferase